MKLTLRFLRHSYGTNFSTLYEWGNKKFEYSFMRVIRPRALPLERAHCMRLGAAS